MSDEEPLKHIYRPSLPWQTVRLTECGQRAQDVAVVITRPEAKTLANKVGRTRLHMLCCVTCINRANYQVDSWEDDPAGVMVRHCEGASRRRGRDPSEPSPIILELRALALLVEAHREEFDQAVADLAASVSLADLRRDKAKRFRSVSS